MGDNGGGNQAMKASADSMLTVADKAPLTFKRKVRSDLDVKLAKPCMLLLQFFVQFERSEFDLRSNCSTILRSNAYLNDLG